jgi:hypothetical protein
MDVGLGAEKLTTVVITNTRIKGKLTVSKQVTGNMGDTSSNKKFPFHLTLNDEEGNSVGTLTYEKGKKGETGNKTTGSLSPNPSDGSYQFELAHNEEIVFKGIPTGSSYTIEEIAGTEDPYQTSLQVDNGEWVEENSYSGTFVIPTAITFRNHKNVQIPTGIFTEGLPYLLMVVFAALLMTGSIVFGYRRKRRAGDN